MQVSINQDGSVVKIKRQLKFDSALYVRNSEDHQHLVNRQTPQSLKALLNSERQLSLGIDKHDLNCESDPLIQLSDLKVRHSTPVKDYENNDDDQFTPKTKGQSKKGNRMINYQQYSQDIGGLGGYFSLPWSSSSGFSEVEEEETPDKKRLVKPYKIETDLKLNKIEHLVHINDIIQKRQYNEALSQFRAPLKKIRGLEGVQGLTAEEIEQLTKENSKFDKVNSRQGYNTDEKKVIYDASYLQRLGLPIPETVMKQKKLESKIVGFKVEETFQNSESSAAERQYKKHIPSKELFESSFLESQKQETYRYRIVDPTKNNIEKQNPQPATMKLIQSLKLQANRAILGIRRVGHSKNEENDDIEGENETQRNINQKNSRVQQKAEEKQTKRNEIIRQMFVQENYIPSTQDLQPHQLNSQQLQQKQPVRMTIPISDKQIIYIAWVSKNLQDLNYWVQKSKSNLDVKFIEVSIGFQCSIQMTISSRIGDPLCSTGVSISKKDARRNAMERLAALIIADEPLFWEGITGANYIEGLKAEFGDILNTPKGQILLKNAHELRSSGNKITEEMVDINEPLQEEREAISLTYEAQLRANQLPSSFNHTNSLLSSFVPQGQVPSLNVQSQTPVNEQFLTPQHSTLLKMKFKIQKNLRQILDSLKNDRIVEALDKLSIVGSLKTELVYKDFCYIWSYGVHKKNLTLLRIVLDVVHYRKFSPQMKQMLQNHSSTDTFKNLVSASSDNRLDVKNIINSFINRELQITRQLGSTNLLDRWNPTVELLANEMRYEKLIEVSTAEQLQIRSSSWSIDEINMFSLSQLDLVRNLGLSTNSELLMKQRPSFFERRAMDTSRHQNEIQQNRFRKDPYLQYLSLEDVNLLYNSLMYVNDKKFALEVCELVFTCAKIDAEQLVQQHQMEVVQYLATHKLSLFQEFFELSYQPTLEDGSTENASMLKREKGEPQRIFKGCIEYLGCNYEDDIFSLLTDGEQGEIVTPDICGIEEGDLCEAVLLKNGSVFQVLVKQVSLPTCLHALSSQVKVQLVTQNPQLRREITNLSRSLMTIKRIVSVRSVQQKNAHLDNLCTRLCMFHSIFKAIIEPTFIAQKDSISGSGIVSTEIGVTELAIIHDLNTSQLVAVKSGSTEALTLVQGAKQSGKFRVAICIISEWMLQSNLKILVKCESHKKARHFFNYITSAMSALNRTQSHLMQYSSQQNSHLPPPSIAATNVSLLLGVGKLSVESFDGKQRLSHCGKVPSKLKKVIEESRITIMSGDLDRYYKLGLASSLQNCQFNRVIVYEAEQQSQSDCWAILQKNCTQCVLIGDLTAVRRSPSSSLLMISRDTDRSMFETIAEKGVKPIMLSERYFPHSISKESSIFIDSLYRRLFFLTQSSNQLQHIQPYLQPLLVIAAQGKQETLLDNQTEICSIFNQIEVGLTVAVINSLLRDNNEIVSRILVIAATQAQRKQIDTLLLNTCKIAVKVQTLEDVIMTSYETVIFSGVLSNKQGVIGRAVIGEALSSLLQHTLGQFIFVGDISLYSKDPTWKQFFEIAKQRDAVKFYSQSYKQINDLQVKV